jgi:hypothetical protein
VDRRILQDMQKLSQDREVPDGKRGRGVWTYMLANDVFSVGMSLRKKGLQGNHTADSEETEQILV